MLNPASLDLVVLVVSLAARSRRRREVPIVSLLLLLVALPSLGDDGLAVNIALRGTTPTAVGKFERYEIAFDLSRHYDDPFDPEVIDIQARFTAPSGKEIVISGFYFLDYPRTELMKRCERGVSCEQPPAAGGHTGAHWRVRFAPQEEGQYQACLVARDKQGGCRLDLPEFTSVKSDNPGFIHVKSGQRILEHESGKPFVPIGECLWNCYSLQDYLDHLKVYTPWGMNYCRFFTAYDSPLYIDNAFYAGDVRRPLGQYDLFALRQLDLFFDMAGQYGVYVMPCVEMFNAFRVTPPYPHWEVSSYNVKNGGPCKSVPEFFTNEAAIKYYKRKMRYLIARYGYSPNLFCIQLFAEANYIEQYNEAEVRAWHHQIGHYIHSIDPNGHLVSTSMADWQAQDKTLYSDSSLDIVLNENYNARDFAGDIVLDNQGILQRYGKPAFDGEAGLQFNELYVKDERGLFLHNGIWASVLSGACGTPSNWFHDYTREKHWLPSYKAFADFIKGEDLRGLHPIAAEVISCEPKSINPDQIIPFPFTNPEGASGPQTVAVSNDRFIDQAIPNMPTIFVPKYQRDGASPNPNFNPLTFDVDFAADGVFRVRARWLEDFNAGYAMMRISVDGQLVKEVKLGAESGVERNWDASMKNLFRSSLPFEASVSRGKHQIALENHGTIWISGEVDLSNYLKSEVANARVVGLGSGERAYLWIQNRDSTWWRDCLNQAPRPIDRALIEVRGFAPGSYEVEWRDPWGVKPGKTQLTKTENGCLRLAITGLERDIACKIKREL